MARMSTHLRSPIPRARMLGSLGIVGIAACLAVMSLAPAGAGTDPRTTDIAFLFALSAEKGSLRIDGDGNSGALVLRDVTSTVAAFSDRPARVVRAVPLARFVDRWDRQFATSAPNAAVVLAGGDEDSDIVVAVLEDPRYDAERKILRFSVEILTEEPGVGLASFRDQVDRRLPRRFGPVSVFVDDAPSPGNEIEIVLMNETDDPAEFTVARAPLESATIPVPSNQQLSVAIPRSCVVTALAGFEAQPSNTIEVAACEGRFTVISPTGGRGGSGPALTQNFSDVIPEQVEVTNQFSTSVRVKVVSGPVQYTSAPIFVSQTLDIKPTLLEFEATVGTTSVRAMRNGLVDKIVVSLTRAADGTLALTLSCPTEAFGC